MRLIFCPVNVRKWIKIYSFQWIFLRSKRSTGDVKSCFDKPAENCRQKSKSFSLKIWKPKKIVFFLRKKVPQNVPLDTSNAHSTSQAKSSSQKSDFVPMKMRKFFFSSKCSPGHLDCIFNKLARKLQSKVGQFLQIKSKNDETKFCFSINQSSKCSPGHPNCTFDKLARKFPQKHGKVLAEKVRFWRKDFFPKKKSSKFLLCRRKRQFWQSFREFFAKSWLNF